MQYLPYVVLAVVMGAVWWAVMLRHGGLLAASLATLLIGIVFGHPFFHAGSITTDRLLFLILIATACAYWLLGWHNGTRLAGLDLPVMMLVGAVAFSTFTHDWRWNENLPATRLAFYYLMPLGMYWVGRQTRMSPAAISALMTTFAILGIYLSVTAVGEKFDQYWAVFPKYIVSPEYPEFLGRGRGPLLNPSANGVLITTGLSCLLMLWPRENRIAQIAVGVGTLVYLAGTYATLTRCVWLATFVCLLLIVCVTFPRRLRWGILVGGILSVAVLVPLNWDRLNSFKRDKNVSEFEMSNSAALRPVLAYVAWEIFKDKPIMGVGHGQYKHYDVEYLGDRSTPLVLEIVRPYHQHNIVLSLLTEVGLVGMLLLTLTLAVWTRCGWALWRDDRVPLVAQRLGLVFVCALIAYFINGMFQDVTIMTMVHMVIFFLAGTVVGLYELQSAASSSLVPDPAGWSMRRKLQTG